MTTAVLSRYIDFGTYGGAELFFHDINNDGVLEIIAYQGPGVFGARMYACTGEREAYMPDHQCVTAFDLTGRRLWTWGKPNPTDRLWVSHAYESCITMADIDGDGNTEVILALGNAIVVLDGCTGQEKNSASLPEDYFYVVHALGSQVTPEDAAIVVKNGEGNYAGVYGQPVMGLRADLQTAWGPKTIPGAGHHIRTIPSFSGDGSEYLIGYCSVRPDGEISWLADIFHGQEVDNDEKHVDYDVNWLTDDGRFLIAIAGSDCGYLMESGGKTLWTVTEGHMQGVGAGRFLGDRQTIIAFYNAPDGPVVFCDMQGNKLSRVSPPRLDETGQPLSFPDGLTRRFHRNRPVFTARGRERDWLIFADGGWPWGMDGEGRKSLEFPPPDPEQRIDWVHPPIVDEHRMDDLGLSYAAKVIPSDSGQTDQVFIYNRRNLWCYEIS